MNAHSTHCCPKHGCKYGDPGCPIYFGEELPYYFGNNGCEICEYTETKKEELETRLDALERRLEELERHSIPHMLEKAFERGGI
jgi:hypothetical protein